VPITEEVAVIPSGCRVVRRAPAFRGEGLLDRLSVMSAPAVLQDKQDGAATRGWLLPPIAVGHWIGNAVAG
jgi:hypothetical protein